MIQPIIVFDFGGVLIDWDPRHLYRKMFNGDDQSVEAFLEETRFFEWNLQQDAGRPFENALTEISSRYPQHSEKFISYVRRFNETIAGPIWPTVTILEKLKNYGYSLFGLSNWSAETFPIIRAQYQFFNWFEDILISGEVGMVKPDPAIFHLLLDRIGCESNDCLFIDNSIHNIDAARNLGFKTIHYTSSDQLVQDLDQIGVGNLSFD